MSSYLTIEFINKINSESLRSTMLKLAEYTSSYPDLSIEIPTSSAYETKAAIFVVTLLTEGRKQYFRYKFFERVAQKCFIYGYEGQWREVQEILEIKALTPRDIIKHFENTMSKEDIFGNMIPTINKVLNRVKIVGINPLKKTKVRRPKRKRGYDDKGTLRLSHEKHDFWEYSGMNPEREDRRHLISYPSRRVYWKGSET